MHEAKKRMGLAFLSLIGAFRVGRWLSRHCVLVLTYHRVLPNEYQSKGQRPANSLFRWEFEKQIAYLVRRYHLVSGEEMQAFLAGEGQLPPYSVLITFDDGYENNYTEAFPVLRRYDASAIFFLTTNLLGRSGVALWFDRLDAVLSNVSHVDVLDWLASQGAPSEVRSQQQARQWLKRMSQPRQEKVIAGLERQFGQEEMNREKDRVISALMNWDQVREMSAQGMTFGSHTANHQILSCASSHEVLDELITSRQRIEEEVGHSCWCFGYPNGKVTDFRPSDKAAVRAAGYMCAFTQIPGFVNRNSDLCALPRMPIPDTGERRVFLSHLSGVHLSFRSMAANIWPWH